MKKFLQLLPWACLVLFAVEIVAVMMPKKDGELHTREFGRLPVLLNGRIQPFDSVARNSLLQIRSTGDVPVEFVTNKLGRLEGSPGWKFWHHPKKLRSTEWLLEVLFKPDVADTRYIFLIHHPDIISELKLGESGVENSGLRYYTFEQLSPVLREVQTQAQHASEVKDGQRTAYQKQMLKLANAVITYSKLRNSIQPEHTHSFNELITEYQAAIPAGVAAAQAQRAGKPGDEEALQKIAGIVQQFDAVANLALPLTVPPLEPEKDRDAWVNTGVSLLEAIRGGKIHPAVGFYARMATAYAHDNAVEFNSAVAGYKNWLATDFGRELRKGRAEYYFNQVKLFLHAAIIYIFAFVLAGGALLTFGAWPGISESLRRSAFWLIGLAFVVHTFGLIFRMVLEGRPPVTNLYSSAIFIGWGACVLGMALERIYKVGLGAAVAAIAGFVTLFIAHNLAMDGDTMEMMRAVLDTNFWLATHVVVVTLGYASTFVAGVLALAYVVLGVFTKSLTQPLSPMTASVTAAAVSTVVKTGGSSAKTFAEVKTAAEAGELGKALTKMIYGIVCFATLFSFTGTVLGGIWADQSWGRFWGWDPKENGALLIVIWNALILHARWGGLVKERGLANLAIFGNVITAWSWFGVNMLGIGLHAYGFMDQAFKWLMLFFGSQIAIIVLGCLPLASWKSFGQTKTEVNSGKPVTVG